MVFVIEGREEYNDSSGLTERNLAGRKGWIKEKKGKVNKQLENCWNNINLKGKG